MKGVIAFANVQRGRYAALTEDGDYTIFELLGGDLEVGEAVTGDLTALGGEVYRKGDGSTLDVHGENYHCSRANALAWVSSRS